MHHSTQAHAQRGAALIVALIFLIIMTILGISGIQTSTMETRMAGNSADRNRAFQASEFALQAGRNDLQRIMQNADWQNTFTVAKDDAYYQTLDADCEVIKPWSETSASTSWSNTNSAEAGGFPTQTPALAATPRFMIGLDTVLDPALDCFSDNTAQGFANSEGSVAPKVATFTITSIGYGSQPNTRVRLQETISFAY